MTMPHEKLTMTGDRVTHATSVALHTEQLTETSQVAGIPAPTAYSAEGPGNSRPGRFHWLGASQVGTPMEGRMWSRLSKCCHCSKKTGYNFHFRIVGMRTRVSWHSYVRCLRWYALEVNLHMHGKIGGGRESLLSCVVNQGT